MKPDRRAWNAGEFFSGVSAHGAMNALRRDWLSDAPNLIFQSVGFEAHKIFPWEHQTDILDRALNTVRSGT